eukprot:SM000045S16292  [mRNA]  locus=s45:783920:785587:+ [translate_table: standard]
MGALSQTLGGARLLSTIPGSVGPQAEPHVDTEHNKMVGEGGPAHPSFEEAKRGLPHTDALDESHASLQADAEAMAGDIEARANQATTASHAAKATEGVTAAGASITQTITERVQKEYETAKSMASGSGAKVGETMEELKGLGQDVVTAAKRDAASLASWPMQAGEVVTERVKKEYGTAKEMASGSGAKVGETMEELKGLGEELVKAVKRDTQNVVDNVTGFAKERYEKESGQASQIADNLKGTGEQLKGIGYMTADAVKQRLGMAGEKVNETAGMARESANVGMAKAQGAASDMSEQAKETVGHVREEANAGMAKARGTVHDAEDAVKEGAKDVESQIGQKPSKTNDSYVTQ